VYEPPADERTRDMINRVNRPRETSSKRQR